MFYFSSRRRHTICALVTGVQTCALPISPHQLSFPKRLSALQHPKPGIEPVTATSLLPVTVEFLRIRFNRSVGERSLTSIPLKPVHVVIAAGIGRASRREKVCRYV